MRRIGLIVSICILSALILVPSLAQDGKSITHIVENQTVSEFTILQEFLDAAPHIRNRLNRFGNYTFFAPSDAAFDKLEDSLGLSLDDILANSELVNTILNYHILNRSFTTQQLSQSNGNSLLSLLSGATIGIQVSDTNSILLNDNSEIIQGNLRASNGVLHVVDEVLNHSQIDDIVANISDNAPSSVAAQVTTGIATANVRVAHFSTDAPDFDVIFDPENTLADNRYGTVSDFVSVPQGIYSATLLSTETERRLEIDLELTILNGDFVTLLLIGSYENESLEIVALQEDFDDLDADEARILVYNAIADSPSVNVVIDDELIFESVTFAESDSIDMDAANVQLSIAETRSADAILLGDIEQEFSAMSFYFVALFGTADAPEILILENSQDEILILQTGQSENSNSNNGSDSDMRDGTIVDVLDAEPDFTKLIRALNEDSEAGGQAINILGNPDTESVTFLAPNDAAFANLLVTIGYSEERFFANTDLVVDILLYHIVDESLFAEDFRALSGTSVITQLGRTQAFFVRADSDGTIFLNGSVEIERADIQAINGVIHIVDDVLLPQPVLDELGL